MNSPKPPTRMPVLVVEDEPLVRIFMADFLEEAGFKVFEAVNADEAITVLEARPDVQTVITDIEMPGSMNGLELAKVIHQRWPRIGIVVTSGRKRPSVDELSEGATFLAKPYLPEVVIRIIQQASAWHMTEHRAGSSYHGAAASADAQDQGNEQRLRNAGRN